MSNDISFYCPAIHNNDAHNHIRKVLNDLSDSYNTIMFNSQYNAIDQFVRKYTVLHCNQARYFYGTMFVFDIDSVSVTKEFPAPKHKIFVAPDIFWQNKMTPSSAWTSLLPEDMHIITHDQRIYDLYSICFKKPLLNMSNGLSKEEVNNVIQSLQQTE